MKRIFGPWAGTLAVMTLAGAAALAVAQSGQKDTVTVRTGDSGERVVLVEKTPEPIHWTELHLESLRAEQEPGQSIYLSAVQIVQLERRQGDVRKAIPTLEGLSIKAPTLDLKNAIIRLLVDISLEEGDYKAAEKYLQQIIEQSLVQY